MPRLIGPGSDPDLYALIFHCEKRSHLRMKRNEKPETNLVVVLVRISRTLTFQSR
jgi:hypothetical protein